MTWLLFLLLPQLDQIKWKNDFVSKGLFFPLFSFSVHYVDLKIKSEKGFWSQKHNWVKLDFKELIELIISFLT